MDKETLKSAIEAFKIKQAAAKAAKLVSMGEKETSIPTQETIEEIARSLDNPIPIDQIVLENCITATLEAEEKPFCCAKCNEAFYTSQGLHAHEHRHEIADNKVLATCTDVEESLRIKSALDLNNNKISNNRSYLQITNDVMHYMKDMTLEEKEEHILELVQRLEDAKTAVLAGRRSRAESLDLLSEEEREVRRQYKVQKSIPKVSQSKETKKKDKGQSALDKMYESAKADFIASGMDEGEASLMAREQVYG